jgi:hypothetical protein
MRERKAWSYSISADLCATRSRYQLSAEGAANEAINVRKLLGEQLDLVPDTSRDNLNVSVHGRAADHLAGTRLGLPVGRHFMADRLKCRKCASLQ